MLPRSSIGCRSYSVLSILRPYCGGLHEFLDSIQGPLIAVTREISTAFFGYDPEASQMQTARSH
jgi:hypothetical protein